MYDYGSDRRIFARFDVDFPADFKISGMPGYSRAICRDVSAGGVGVLSDVRLGPKTVLDLVLRFPDASSFDGLAQVIWSKQVYEGRWRIGLQLINADLMKLRKFLSFSKAG